MNEREEVIEEFKKSLYNDLYFTIQNDFQTHGIGAKGFLFNHKICDLYVEEAIKKLQKEINPNHKEYIEKDIKSITIYGQDVYYEIATKLRDRQYQIEGIDKDEELEEEKPQKISFWRALGAFLLGFFGMGEILNKLDKK